MDAQQMRETYINFFKERGHAQISSAPLIPENDPTVRSAPPPSYPRTTPPFCSPPQACTLWFPTSSVRSTPPEGD